MDAATERFAALLRLPEKEIALDEACFVIAAHARPELDIEGSLAAIDRLAEQIVEHSVEGVVSLLYRDLGFRGNTENYGDPANSLLDQVLERRLGIPISLAVVTIEVGRRVGADLAGVGMPGHFLVRDRNDPPTFFDVFDGGRALDVDGCAALFHRMQGPATPFDARWLSPVGAHAILARVLANLQAVFEQRRDRKGVVWALRLRTMVPGVPPGERRAYAAAMAAAGDHVGAAREFESLAELVKGRDEALAARFRGEATRLLAQLN